MHESVESKQPDNTGLKRSLPTEFKWDSKLPGDDTMRELEGGIEEESGNTRCSLPVTKHVSQHVRFRK